MTDEATTDTNSKQFVVRLSGKQRELMTEDLVRGHVEYLRELKERGVLPFCGPCADGTALMILSCDSLETARELVAGDPFSEVDYYEDRDIVEIEEATEENDFLLADVLEFLST